MALVGRSVAGMRPLAMIRSDAPAIGAEICSSPTVRKVGFTGSTAVGKLLMRQAADTVKKVSLVPGPVSAAAALILAPSPGFDGIATDRPFRKRKKLSARIEARRSK